MFMNKPCGNASVACFYADSRSRRSEVGKALKEVQCLFKRKFRVLGWHLESMRCGVERGGQRAHSPGQLDGQGSFVDENVGEMTQTDSASRWIELARQI